jgi:hypothetical protein
MNNEQIIQLLNDTQRQLSEIYIPELPGRQLVGVFQDLPGIVGIWYTGNVQRSTGNIYDSSRQGRTMTYTGNPVFNYTDNGIAYVAFDGTGDYFIRTDETDLDILGTESWAGRRGLTQYVIFRTSDVTPAANMLLFGKNSGAGGRAYYIILLTTGILSALVSVDGTATVSVSSTATLSNNTWYIVGFSYVPSTSLTINVNGTVDTNLVGVPASIFNSSAGLTIGATAIPNLYLTGDISLCALYANSHSEAIMGSVFQQIRSLYGI